MLWYRLENCGQSATVVSFEEVAVLVPFAGIRFGER